MKDQYGRTIDYLRISITDACNLRCRYCMPESAAGCALEQAEQESAAYRRRDAEDCARRGWAWHHALPDYRREPLVRKECVELVQKIKAVPGTASVGITTNGVRLASCARDLKAAGCDSVNVSLDTVDAAEFAALTGRDALEQVKQGICAAKEAGLLVKLNAVHRKELHAQELIEFAEQEKVPVRFIEVMPVGAGKSYVGPSNEALKTELEQWYGACTPDQETPSVKSFGFASSLNEGASGEEEKLAVLPKAPSPRGLAPKVTGGVSANQSLFLSVPRR